MSSYIHNKKISSSEYFDRIRKSGRDQFTVMPEFGVTVYDAINAPFDRDSNKPVYAHLPSRESQIQKRGAYQANQSLTTMYKRKAPSNVYNNARFDAEFGPSAPVAHKRARTELQVRAASQQAAWQAKNSLATQVRRLIQGKKKDAADVTRSSSVNLTVSRIGVLTSSTAAATAASGTGLISSDADKAQINSVSLRGFWDVRPMIRTLAQGQTAFGGCRARMLVVWFYKPQTATSAAGTVPPITEVLVSDSVDSMVVPDTQNAGRFSILSDRIWDLGSNVTYSDAPIGYQYPNGKLIQSFNYTVKVNKSCSFTKNADPTTNLGGHYDSDVQNGQVSRGLLVLYALSVGNTGATTDCGTIVHTCISRLNYTA